MENTLRNKDGEALSAMETQSEGLQPSTMAQKTGADLGWFAVYTSSRHEKHVFGCFCQRQLESFLPLCPTVRHWKNRRKVTLELPLFPNYVFVHIARHQRIRVLEVPGVLAIVGRGCEPIAIPDSGIESLRAGLRLRRLEPHPYLVVGERVRIKTGPMERREGILVRKKNGIRVVLTLEVIGRSFAVELDADDVEPLAAKPKSEGNQSHRTPAECEGW